MNLGLGRQEGDSPLWGTAQLRQSRVALAWPHLLHGAQEPVRRKLPGGSRRSRPCHWIRQAWRKASARAERAEGAHLPCPTRPGLRVLTALPRLPPPPPHTLGQQSCPRASLFASLSSNTDPRGGAGQGGHWQQEGRGWASPRALGPPTHITH